MLAEHQLDLLAQHRWVTVCPWLGQDVVHHAIDACQHLDLRPAAISHGTRRRIDPSQRRDSITWLPDPTAGAPDAFAPLRNALETLRQQLNQTLYLGLQTPTIQVAHYPGDGAFYRRHKDAMPGSVDRRITCIWYLNENWVPEHGGELVLLHDDGSQDIVPPRADQAVIFLADEVEHEVRPAYHSRWAVTAWFPTRPPSPIR